MRANPNDKWEEREEGRTRKVGEVQGADLVKRKVACGSVCGTKTLSVGKGSGKRIDPSTAGYAGMKRTFEHAQAASPYPPTQNGNSMRYVWHSRTSGMNR